MDSVEDYARQWANREKEDLDLFPNGGRAWSRLCKLKFKTKLSGSMSTRSTSIFKDQHAAKQLSLLHDKYVIFSVDKASNNICLCVNHIT